MPPRNPNHQHWAMMLHNEMQRRGRLRSLSWDDSVSGPTHNAVWTSIVMIDEVEYGRGTSATRQGARDEAARQALVVLQQELYNWGNLPHNFILLLNKDNEEPVNYHLQTDFNSLND